MRSSTLSTPVNKLVVSTAEACELCGDVSPQTFNKIRKIFNIEPLWKSGHGNMYSVAQLTRVMNGGIDNNEGGFANV